MGDVASVEIGRLTGLGSTVGLLLGIALVAASGVRGAILLFAFTALTRSTRKRGSGRRRQGGGGGVADEIAAHLGLKFK